MSARLASSSSAALDAWRDAEVARFASTLQKHAKAAIATNAATLASAAASAPHHEPPQHHNKSSSKVGYAAPPPTALRSAAVEWMKTSGLAPPPPLSQHATAAASSSKSSSSSSSKISGAPPPAAPPLPLPQLGKNPSVHALTLAARRAGAEEAARRRQRTQDLAAALRTPLRRSFFCEWRDRSRLLYLALCFGHDLAKERALRRWLDCADARRVEGKRRWLRRWRCVLNVRNARYAKEDAVALRTRERALGTALRALAARARSHAILLAADDYGALQRVRGGMRLWHRIACKRAAAQKLVAGRAGLRALRRHARLELAAYLGSLGRGLRRWRRHLALIDQHKLLASALQDWAKRAVYRRQKRQMAAALRAAAVRHANRSAAQHALARMLVVGWRSTQRDQQMVQARHMGYVRNTREALQRWRHHAVSYGQWQATRDALRRSMMMTTTTVAADMAASYETEPPTLFGAGGVRRSASRRQSSRMSFDAGDFLASGFPAALEEDEDAGGLLPAAMAAPKQKTSEGMRRAAGTWMRATGVDATTTTTRLEPSPGEGPGRLFAAGGGGGGVGGGGAAVLLAMAEDALNSPTAQQQHHHQHQHQHHASALHQRSSLSSESYQNAAPAAPTRTPTTLPAEPAAGATEKAALLLDQLVRRNVQMSGRGSDARSRLPRASAPTVIARQPLRRTQNENVPHAEEARRAVDKDAIERPKVQMAAAILPPAPPSIPAPQVRNVSEDAMAALRARLSLQVTSPSYLAYPPVRRAQQHPRDQ